MNAVRCYDRGFTTRSVVMSSARRFNAGTAGPSFSCRVAMIESCPTSRRRYATRQRCSCFPALKGRAKLTPTLRVESPLGLSKLLAIQSANVIWYLPASEMENYLRPTVLEPKGSTVQLKT